MQSPPAVMMITNQTITPNARTRTTSRGRTHDVRSVEDPLSSIVADGRVLPRPNPRYRLPTVITVDLEFMAENIDAYLLNIFFDDARIRNRYNIIIGSENRRNRIYEAISRDVTALVNFLMGHTYNKLRSILEAKAPNHRLTRMKNRCPVPPHQEFPTWLSATLSAIGPCRVADGPVDTLFVYATPVATMDHYGRANAITFNEVRYNRLTQVLRDLHVPLAPFHFQIPTAASCFPTLDPSIRRFSWTIYAPFHPSHYEDEDVARIAIMTNALGLTPFECVGTTIGFVDNVAALNALAAVAPPEGLPAGQNAESEGRPVSGHFRVNFYGIQPAVAAGPAQPAQARGCYILGRGTQRYYQTILANNVTNTEIFEILRHRVIGSLATH